MIELSAIGGILDVANKLWTLRGSLAKAGNERRVAIAVYLGDVGVSIAGIATALKANFNADVAQLCAELKTYGEAGSLVLAGVLPDAEIENLSVLMTQPARLFASTRGRQDVVEADRVQFIATLDEAAGRLRATSNILRVGDMYGPETKQKSRIGWGQATTIRSLSNTAAQSSWFKRYIPKSKIGRIFFWIGVFYAVIFVLYGIFYMMGLIDPNSCDFNNRYGCRN